MLPLPVDDIGPQHIFQMALGAADRRLGIGHSGLCVGNGDRGGRFAQCTLGLRQRKLSGGAIHFCQQVAGLDLIAHRINRSWSLPPGLECQIGLAG